jgi:23S rRNA (cytidine1920-2'-O)/16S rRNA (cytidine1409-2'-O)-methyltransferase
VTPIPPPPSPEPDPAKRFVGRGGLKLRHALDEFGIDPAGVSCADLGCNVGGFTDCLLQAGAACVYAVDTGYGALAWTLRKDPRVRVMERTNALHAPAPPGGVDLVVIDLGWTPQRHAVPAAVRWVKPGGRVVSLIKPHYELSKDESARLLRDGVLDEAVAVGIAERTARDMPALGARLLGLTRSPITGGEGKRNKRGNAEWLALLAPLTPASSTPPGTSPTG